MFARSAPNPPFGDGSIRTRLVVESLWWRLVVVGFAETKVLRWLDFMPVGFRKCIEYKWSENEEVQYYIFWIATLEYLLLRSWAICGPSVNCLQR